MFQSWWHSLVNRGKLTAKTTRGGPAGDAWSRGATGWSRWNRACC